jgi:hypothetical protein
MDSVFKKVYVLLHTTPDGSTSEMGEANDQEGLQRLYDTLNDNIVFMIIDSLKRDAPSPFVPKTKLRIRYCNINGLYLQNVATEPLSNLVNTHDDFFRYFEKYKRNLYGDRAVNQEMANILLKTAKEESSVRMQISKDEQTWFKEQMSDFKSRNVPMIFTSFPRFKSHEYLDKLLADSKRALEELSVA